MKNTLDMAFDMEEFARSHREATWKKTDKIGEDGLHYCGICGEAKEEWCRDLVPGKSILFVRDCACRRRELEELDRKEEENRRKERMWAALEMSRMSPRHREQTFEAWVEDDDFPLRGYCESWCETYDRERSKGIIFLGAVGTGKTYAAASIGNRMMRYGYRVCFVTASEYVEAGTAGRTELGKLNDEIDCSRIIILDDFGAERDTATAHELMYNLVNRCVENNKTLIVTTNKTKADFNDASSKDFRTMDRLLELCNVKQVSGESRRRTDFKNRQKGD